MIYLVKLINELTAILSFTTAICSHVILLTCDIISAIYIVFIV